MVTLLERLQHCANPMHCPHGRPTIVRLEPDAIARLFERIIDEARRLERRVVHGEIDESGHEAPAKKE